MSSISPVWEPKANLVAICVMHLSGILAALEEWTTSSMRMGKARRWFGLVLLTYSHRDKKLVKQSAADHTCCLANSTPILALDMYEHYTHRLWRESSGVCRCFYD